LRRLHPAADEDLLLRIPAEFDRQFAGREMEAAAILEKIRRNALERLATFPAQGLLAAIPTPKSSASFASSRAAPRNPRRGGGNPHASDLQRRIFSLRNIRAWARRSLACGFPPRRAGFRGAARPAREKTRSISASGSQAKSPCAGKVARRSRAFRRIFRESPRPHFAAGELPVELRGIRSSRSSSAAGCRRRKRAKSAGSSSQRWRTRPEDGSSSRTRY